MSPAPRRRMAFGVVAAAVLLAPPAAAQEATASGLGLEEAVRTALARNPGLLIARRGLDGADAEVLRARGAFDTRVAATGSEARRQAGAFDASGSVAADPLSTRTSSYELRLARELGYGLVVQPGVTVARVDDPQRLAVPYAQAGASLGVTAPLGANRGGSLTRWGLREAEIGREAAGHEARDAAAATVRDVVGAYWEYRASHQRLAVHRSAEERATRLLEDTRRLVAAQERASTDLIQLEANLASKRMTRLNAEQQREAAQQRLGLLMGVGAADAARLPPPAEPFPAAVAPSDAEAGVDRLVALALARRADLTASELRVGAARVRERAARGAAQGALDLTMEVGYAGLATAAAVGDALSPLYRDIPGLNLTLQLSYQGVLSSSAARGAGQRAAAALEQRRLGHDALREEIASAVALAAASLERSRLLLVEADGAVALFSRAVENEQAKYRLGTATLFDVILAEDNVTTARLSEVDAGLSHAAALARLRWATGTLLEDDGGDAGFTPSLATTRP